jgi:hypothetical protein
MKQTTLVNMLLMFAAVIGALLLSSVIAVAQTSTNNNSTAGSGSRDSEGAARSGRYRKRGDCTVEGIASSDADRSTSDSSGNRTESESIAWKADDVRPQYVAL